MGVISFNSVSSADVGIEVETFPDYSIPDKEYEVIHVPGRNGDVIIDTGTYKNVSRVYEVSIATYDISFHRKMARVAQWLYTASGYARLEDSYEPDFYRLAYYNKKVDIENLFNQAGKAKLEFICKPQRFLKSGDLPVTYTGGSGTIVNETNFDALPIINLTTNNTSGALAIGNTVITIHDGAGQNLTVNSELQDVYSGNANKNSYVTLNTGVFPNIKPGTNTILFSGGITSVSITPKWYTI